MRWLRLYPAAHSGGDRRGNLQGGVSTERGESYGSVKAVSIDGSLVFIANEAHGGWIFVDDAEQQVITPNIN